jgi:hypothetical protein
MDEESRLLDAAHVCSDENIRRVWDQSIKYMSCCFQACMYTYVVECQYTYTDKGILSCNQCDDDHPENNLANFGYVPVMKF